MDLTQDSVTADNLIAPHTAHNAAGLQITGNAVAGGGGDGLNPTLETEWVDVYSDWAAGYYYDPDNDYAYTQIPSTETTWVEAETRTGTSCTPYSNMIPVEPGEEYRYENLPIHFDSKNKEVPGVIIFDVNKAEIDAVTRTYQDEGSTLITIPAGGAWMAVLYYNSQPYLLQKKVAKRLDKNELLDTIKADYRAYTSTAVPTASTLTKTYICLGTDDLRGWETKNLHTMFTTNNIPYYMAAIPENIKACVTNDPYKTNLDYMRLCVAAGGEIISHSNPVITEQNKNDFDTMYTYFCKNKEQLEYYGFKVRGIFKAGGENAIYNTADPVIDAWAVHYYDFGDYFGGEFPYGFERTLLDDWADYSYLANAIRNAMQNHTPFIGAFHYYNSNAELAMSTILDVLEDYTEGTDYEFVTPSQLYDIMMPTSRPSSGGGDVQSVNGKTGTVILNASDVGALPSSTTIPTRTSDLINDSYANSIHITANDLIQGTYNRNGSVNTNTRRIRLKKFINVSAGDVIHFIPGDGQGILCGYVNQYQNTVETAWTATATDIVVPFSCQLMIMFRYTSGDVIEPSDYACNVTVELKAENTTAFENNGEIFRCLHIDPISYGTTYANFIAKYDELITRATTINNTYASGSQKPVTITKTTLQTLSSGNAVYKYVFSPAYPKKTVFIIAGVHGDEYEGIWGLYHMMRIIYTETYSNPMLKEIRDNVKFVIIPCVNPNGFDNNTRTNADGLNIQDYFRPQNENVSNPPAEFVAVKDTAISEHFDFFLDIHTDPYTPSSGCYGYALTEVNTETYPYLYNITQRFREILLLEYGYESGYKTNDSYAIIGSLGSPITEGGSVGYMYRHCNNGTGVLGNLIEIGTNAKTESAAFVNYNTSDCIMIAVDWYMNVLITMYNNIFGKSGDYSISISDNVITLTGTDGNTSSITLPIYTGGVS